uniref:Trm112p-like protein n=1 Tax=Trypanosoma congolense (strain IL3000) TaxID=1068625 RepID=G0UQC4_TRYCI|nr:conserved hypothetical protein [Trypanosoma congolense IL3000]
MKMRKQTNNKAIFSPFLLSSSRCAVPTRYASTFQCRRVTLPPAECLSFCFIFLSILFRTGFCCRCLILESQRKKEMRLLTHNFLCCIQCQSFPLQLQATEVEVLECEFNAEFIRTMLARMDYGYLLGAFNALRAQKHTQLEKLSALPETIEDIDLADESEDLRALQYAIQCIAVREGKLRCPQCEREYPIREFIPDMIIAGQ